MYLKWYSIYKYHFSSLPSWTGILFCQKFLWTKMQWERGNDWYFLLIKQRRVWTIHCKIVFSRDSYLFTCVFCFRTRGFQSCRMSRWTDSVSWWMRWYPSMVGATSPPWRWNSATWCPSSGASWSWTTSTWRRSDSTGQVQAQSSRATPATSPTMISTLSSPWSSPHRSTTKG